MSGCVLLNINWRNLAEIGRMDKYAPVIPLDLMYVSSALDEKGIVNKIVDLWGMNKQVSDVRDEIEKAEFIVLNTAPTYIFWRDGTIDANLPKEELKKIRGINPNARLIVIGPHGTVTPETFEIEGVDYILRGEPDLAAAELVEGIIKNGQIKIPGVCENKGNTWITGGEYATVSDLAELPVLHYEKMDKNNYFWPEPPKGFGIKKTTEYECSRGCPYKCIFCFREGFRGRLREKPMERIAEELGLIKQQGYDYVYLIDECFGANQKWAAKVCAEFRKAGLKWGIQTRPETLNAEILKAYADSGCVKIELGLESVDRAIARTLGKGSVDLLKLRGDIETMISLNIRPTLFIIIGSPGENAYSIRALFNYVKQFPLDKLEINPDIMLPYPKTPLWNMGIAEGKQLRDWNDVMKYKGTIGNCFKTSEEAHNAVIKFLNAISIEKRKRELAAQIRGFKKQAPLTFLRLAKSYMAVYFPALDRLISRAVKDKYTALVNKERYVDYARCG